MSEARSLSIFICDAVRLQAALNKQGCSQTDTSSGIHLQLDTSDVPHAAHRPVALADFGRDAGEELRADVNG